MKFATYPEVQQELSAARFNTLRGLVTRANADSCDLFVVAGDLFDRRAVSSKDVKMAVECLSDFEGKAVAVLPGNHDYFAGKNAPPWGEFGELAQTQADRLLILDEPRAFSLSHFDLPVCLYAAPCISKHSGQNVVDWMPEHQKNENEVHIGVAHGSVEGLSPDFAGDYYPMAPLALDKKNLNCWLIGHTHIRYPDKFIPGDRLFVPGTPEPDGFDCRHNGTAWILQFDDNSQLLDAEALETGFFRFLRVREEIRNLQEIVQIKDRYKDPKLLLDLFLHGSLPNEAYLTFLPILDELRENLFYLRCDSSGLMEDITPELINRSFSEGSFPHLLLHRLLQENDREAVQEAYGMLTEGKW